MSITLCPRTKFLVTVLQFDIPFYEVALSAYEAQATDTIPAWSSACVHTVSWVYIESTVRCVY